MSEPPSTLPPTGSSPPLALGASPLRKRSLVLAGHPTSLALEDPFWRALERWAAAEGRVVSDLVAQIDAARTEGSLASAVRVALLLRAEARAAGER